MKATLALLVALILATGNSLQAAEPSKPNIVLIMVDDFGYECVTANGGQSYQTPNIDQLAATGMRFEELPTRSSCVRPRGSS